MSKNLKNTICMLITLTIILCSFIQPPEVEARISFHRFNRVTRRVFRKVKQGTKFVVNIPDKATNWMGPVLGPIASTALTGNIAKNPRWSKIINKARRANRVIDTADKLEEQQKYLSDLRKAYREQANDLRKQATNIRESRRQMLNRLSSGEITYDDYKNHVLEINQIANVYELTADKFDNSANNMNPDNIAGIFTRNVINSVWGEVKNAIVYETSQELTKYIDPNVIQRLVNSEGVNLDTLIDIFSSAQIEKQLGNSKDIDADALKDRVRLRVKDILNENREELRGNWRLKVEEIIANSKNELENEKNKLPDVKNEPKDTEKTKDTFEPDPDSADKCSNGYIWDIKIGKCIQENCNGENIPNAHYSYVKDCICGTSGSINEKPEDPNRACKYPTSNKDCPGCVYACVGTKEECPEP